MNTLPAYWYVIGCSTGKHHTMSVTQAETKSEQMPEHGDAFIRGFHDGNRLSLIEMLRDAVNTVTH